MSEFYVFWNGDFYYASEEAQKRTDVYREGKFDTLEEAHNVAVLWNSQAMAESMGYKGGEAGNDWTLEACDSYINEWQMSLFFQEE